MTKISYDYKANVPDDLQEHAKFVDGKFVVDMVPQTALDAIKTKIDTMVMQKALTPFFADAHYDLKPSTGRIIVQLALEEFEVQENGEIRNRNVSGASLQKWIRTDLRLSSPFLYVHGKTTELDKSGKVWIPNEAARAEMTTDELWNLTK